MGRKPKKIGEIIAKGNPFVRDTWADYADKRLVPKYTVSRFDDKADNRFYYFYHDGELIIASGVTEPFGIVSTEREAINRWKEKNPNWRHLLNVSSEYGTLEHGLFGNIALLNKVDKPVLALMQKIATDNDKSPDMPTKDTLAFLKFQEDVKLRPLLVEAQLAYQDPESGEWVALTIDMLAELDVTTKEKRTVQDGVWSRGDKKGEPKMVEVREDVINTYIAIIDFKSNFFEKDEKSFYEVHKMQLMAGKLAVEQNFDIKVDCVYNLAPNNWRVSPTYKFFEHKLTDKDWGIYRAYWNLIIAKGLNKPEGNFIITKNFKNSSDYKMLSYKEYVEQILLNPNNEKK